MPYLPHKRNWRVGAHLACFTVDMDSRQWQIVFHLHGDGTATVRISVNGRLLMPGCAGLPVEEALGYVEAALIDCHAADQLVLRTQGSVGSIRSIRLVDAARAQNWLRERVTELVGELEIANAGSGEGAADSGVRPGLRQQEQAEDRARFGRPNS